MKSTWAGIRCKAQSRERETQHSGSSRGLVVKKPGFEVGNSHNHILTIMDMARRRKGDGLPQLGIGVRPAHLPTCQGVFHNDN